MNITEFERTKPRETMKLINDTILTYKHQRSKLDVLMDQQDAILHIEYTEFLNRLQKIKESFESGK